MNKLGKLLSYLVHDVLDWHKPLGDTWSDGFQNYARCRCGRRIAQDSQGNWFICEPHSGDWR